MSAIAPSIVDFDPQSTEYYMDPQAVLLPMLRDTPIFYYEPLDAYYVLPYHEVRQIVADGENYSNVAYRSTPIGEQLRERISPAAEHAGQIVQDRQLINMDAPEHTPQRRAMQQTFTHRRVATAREDIAAIANDLIDELIDRGSCDLMRDYASKVTLRTVGRMIDVGPEMLVGFHTWVLDVLGLLAPIDMKPEDVTMPDDQLVGIYERVHSAYSTYTAFIEERRRDPGEDLCSAMIQMKDEDGRPALTTDDILAHMVGITAAGTDTTANLIVNMVRYFTEAPDQLHLVMQDPGLWDNAVLEGLRRASISNQLFRRAIKDTEILGVKIPAGTNVNLSLPAANADPAKFPDPLKFDVLRANAKDHLALGRGRHFCLGATLAPPEARIAVEALYRRLPDLQADLTQELEFVPAVSVRGIVSQNVSWTA
jgi:cytochrome P450